VNRTATDEDRFIWATRGARWGFRFLRSADLDDPLVAYDRAFGAVGDAPEVCERDGGVVALRFSDPEGRCDRAGRLIPHEFVLFGPLADSAVSASAGRDSLWPLVQAAYARVFDVDDPSR
jgi:hypothetical protein